MEACSTSSSSSIRRLPTLFYIKLYFWFWCFSFLALSSWRSRAGCTPEFSLVSVFFSSLFLCLSRAEGSHKLVSQESGTEGFEVWKMCSFLDLRFHVLFAIFSEIFL